MRAFHYGEIDELFWLVHYRTEIMGISLYRKRKEGQGKYCVVCNSSVMAFKKEKEKLFRNSLYKV